MERQEKKYRVESFAPTQQHLTEKGAEAGPAIVATHYYGVHEGNDVEKFVEYADRCEIHVLKEQDGKFTMTEDRKIANKDEGIAWLKSRGYTTANIVKMDYMEYSYNDGTVGLYTIDDFLRSVILYYPSNQHDALEKEFGLQSAEVIRVPYNKYLEQLGRLRSLKLG